jgi:hypothetical protein
MTPKLSKMKTNPSRIFFWQAHDILELLEQEGHALWAHLEIKLRQAQKIKISRKNARLIVVNTVLIECFSRI